MAAQKRTRIATAGTIDRPYAHLDPVLAAELAWGNRPRIGNSGWHVTDWHYGGWSVNLERPLHVELLRATFELPEGIILRAVPDRGSQRGSMALVDTVHEVAITAPLPAGWTGGYGVIAPDPPEGA